MRDAGLETHRSRYGPVAQPPLRLRPQPILGKPVQEHEAPARVPGPLRLSGRRRRPLPGILPLVQPLTSARRHGHADAAHGPLRARRRCLRQPAGRLDRSLPAALRALRAQTAAASAAPGCRLDQPAGPPGGSETRFFMRACFAKSLTSSDIQKSMNLSTESPWQGGWAPPAQRPCSLLTATRSIACYRRAPKVLTRPGCQDGIPGQRRLVYENHRSFGVVYGAPRRHLGFRPD
jgi:hypothetical protein